MRAHHLSDIFDSLWLNCHIATMSGAEPYGIVKNGAIGVRDGKIAWLGEKSELPLDVVEKYEAGLYQFIEERHSDIYAEIVEKQEISDELDAKLAEALKAYNEEFKDTIKS